MRISFEGEALYPGNNLTSHTGELYSYYHQSDARESGVHWFDFKTRHAHELTVRYPGELYKLVLCIEGNSRSEPRQSKRYAFNSGQALFYKTEEEPYKALLAAQTAFKVIHIHLTASHVAMLRKDVPSLFDRPLAPMPLSPECTAALFQLKTISRENPALLRLYEEKLITDQLFDLAVHALPRTGGKDILQEALWHIERADRYLTIAELARLSGTNTFRLKQLFRDELQTSVFRYQSDLQLQRGAQLLLETDTPVSEVGQQCGYASVAAFSNAFEKKHGVRPLAFKNARSRK